ncbi:hypothetical protein [Clostridium muellerianum]|uniref:hypothetical protein n=1 Tax=Clostridium muellerianum TaxID=2716538 RepID=UPI001FADF829|nr:hypothetical protein [Clostridium muellerianum]
MYFIKVAIIQASSQKNKNNLLYNSVMRTVKDKKYEVINFGIGYSKQDAIRK